MKKYNLIPLLLTLWLIFMARVGWPHYVSGYYSPLRYFGVIALTSVVIFAVRVSLKRHAKRRDDMQN